MTDTPNTPPALSRTPNFVAYSVRDVPGSKSFWNRVGVAWSNRDGGFTVQLDCLPLDGRVVCQPADRPAGQTGD